LEQDYPSEIQILFGVAAAEDPAASVVRKLQSEFPHADLRLLVCPERLGANAKVSTLAQLEPHARHDFRVVSDADVQVPPDLLRNLIAPLADDGIGLVNPFYAVAPTRTLAMRWEAISVNADFWSGVLQARRLEPLRFALGAVMAVRRAHLARLGGFAALANVLADDFELGRRVAEQGGRIALCPVVVTCREAPRNWAAVWRHQLRWARTIRVCRPAPYAASVLSNATIWPLLWALVDSRPTVWAGATVCLAIRLATAWDNERRLTRTTGHGPWFWLVPVKDLLQCALWALAFLGHTVEWRGEHFRVRRTGELVPTNQAKRGT
jgi:ceramide glucosyltransferase